MNEPLWHLLELTIKTQLRTNPDAACNTLESFINTHVYMNPTYVERLAIIERLDQILININKEMEIPIQVIKKTERKLLKSYERY